MLDEQQMLDAIPRSIFLRGFLVPGGHVAWVAISGAAIVIAAKVKGVFDTGVFTEKKFLRLFATPVVLHGLWDSPLAGWVNNIFPFTGYIALIVLVWMVVLILINRGWQKSVEKVLFKTKECPICRTQYDDPLNFCTKDGHQLKSVETSPVETQKHEKRQNNQHREKKGCLKKIVIGVLSYEFGLKALKQK